MIVVGLVFLMIWVAVGVEYNRREKETEREYELYFGRRIK